MKTTIHYLPGATIEVTPTLEALGDQPWYCCVYPDQLAKDHGYTPVPLQPKTYYGFQSLILVASSPKEAVRAAAREFNALYPNAEQIEIN